MTKKSTSSIPDRLEKAPLIEVIWQLQFEPENNAPVGDILPGVLFSALRTKHPNLQLQRLPSADIPAQMAQIDPNLRYMAKYRIAEPDTPFIFQVGERIITLNCRNPYAGWLAFKEKTLSLVEIIKNTHLVPTIQRHSLRYLNLLRLESAPNLSALQLSIKLGAFNIQNKPLQIRIELPDENCSHVVQIATPAQMMLTEGQLEGSIVDIETFSNETSKNWNGFSEQIECLHNRSKTLFFNEILTKEAVQKMEPVYPK